MTERSKIIPRAADSPNRFLRPMGAPAPSTLTAAFDASSRRRKGKPLKPLHPNAGIEAQYRKRLTAMVDDMAASFQYFIKAAYRKNEPTILAADSMDRLRWWSTIDNTDDPYVMWGGGNPDAQDSLLRVGTVPIRVEHLAMDGTPADDLQKAIDELAKRWRRKFDKASDRMADWFARDVHRRSDAAMRKILKDGGFTVEFKMTPAMRDVLNATIEGNVQLIKSIPQQYLTDVQGAVMRSVQTGRDLGTLTKELQEKHGVTRRRAALIARDQNNKATSAMTRARQTEVGITEAIWQHSHGGNEPRKTHLANSGKRYNIAEGWFDPDPRVRKNIWPGELINCRCVSRPVVKGFS